MKQLLLYFLFLLGVGITYTHATQNPDSVAVVIEGTAQGTSYRIEFINSPGRWATKHQVDSILATIDQCLSTYRPDSEISTFNQTQFHYFNCPYFYPVLKKAQGVFRQTQGAFDPTVYPLSILYRQLKKRRLPIPDRVDSLLQFVNFNYIEFDSVVVSKQKEHVQLDLDGIAQGYSVDVLAGFLQSRGISRYMIELGGEVRAGGHNREGRWWQIGIENPLDPGKLLTTVRLHNRAMATSGVYRDRYQQGGQTINHIINPKTGFARSDSLMSVTVFAADAATADAYATAFVVMGVEKTKRFVMAHSQLDVYLIYQRAIGTTDIFCSQGIQNFVNR